MILAIAGGLMLIPKPPTPIETATSAGTTTPRYVTATTAGTRTEEYMFVGSKESDVYHYPSCQSVKQIKTENLIYFKDSADAIAKG